MAEGNASIIAAVYNDFAKYQSSFFPEIGPYRTILSTIRLYFRSVLIIQLLPLTHEIFLHGQCVCWMMEDKVW